MPLQFDIVTNGPTGQEHASLVSTGETIWIECPYKGQLRGGRNGSSETVEAPVLDRSLPD